MFWLKKFVSFWLMPLPLCLVLLGVGLWLLHREKRARLARGLILTAIALLVLLSNKAVSTWLVQPLESAYPPVPEIAAGDPIPTAVAACRAICVLGGGNAETPAFSAVNKLSVSARARVMEAVRLARVLPDARLILSGPGVPGQPSHAQVMATAAISLGVAPARIVRIESARDTEDESAQIRRLVDGEPFLLVTSAWHMPRAMALMRGAGLRAVPCPTDHLARPAARWRIGDYGWDVESLARSTAAIRERLGYLWVSLRGKT